MLRSIEFKKYILQFLYIAVLIYIYIYNIYYIYILNTIQITDTNGSHRHVINKIRGYV